jgi:hypothetical protein
MPNALEAVLRKRHLDMLQVSGFCIVFCEWNIRVCKYGMPNALEAVLRKRHLDMLQVCIFLRLIWQSTESAGLNLQSPPKVQQSSSAWWAAPLLNSYLACWLGCHCCCCCLKCYAIDLKRCFGHKLPLLVAETTFSSFV